MKLIILSCDHLFKFKAGRQYHGKFEKLVDNQADNIWNEQEFIL